ncbi:MAG: hypothetical protein PHU85_19330 [Phycisphaerae bacterium]|nr:hypothetical protein [Phycisphaerae bacterium]
MILGAELLPLPAEWASFGAAGLMGALWIWERRLSRTRESQLTEAHDRLMAERGLTRLMANLIRRNTAALSRLQVTQDQLVHLLSNWQTDDEPTTAADSKGVA